MRCRETCVQTYKNQKPKSLDRTDVVRDVEKNGASIISMSPDHLPLFRVPTLFFPRNPIAMRFALFWPAESRKARLRKLHVQRVNLFVADVTQGIQGALGTDAGPLT